MGYSDNPKRPNIQMWFGPMSFVDYLSNQTYWVNINNNRNWLPGDCHESPLYSAKVGVAAALTQMQSNQPNDEMSLIYYSTPQTTAAGTARLLQRRPLTHGTQLQLRDQFSLVPADDAEFRRHHQLQLHRNRCFGRRGLLLRR